VSFPQPDPFPDYGDAFRGATAVFPQVDVLPDYSDVFLGASLAPLPFYPDYASFVPDWVSARALAKARATY